MGGQGGGSAAVARNTAPPYRQRLKTFRETLEKVIPRVANIIPQGFDAARLFTVAYMAIERNPKLLDCTEISVLRCIIISAQLGLDISGIGGQAHMVPYKNRRTGHLEAQFIPGWQGLVDLARRSREVAWVYANVVYAKEEFLYEVNPIPRVYHKPLGPLHGGDPLGAYALAIFRDKDVPPQPLVMTLDEIERIRRRSKAADDGPWVTDWAAMARKTPVRALCKFLPQNPQLAAALDVEDRVEQGQEITLPGEVEEFPVEQAGSEPAARADKGNDAVKERMAKARAAKKGRGAQDS